MRGASVQATSAAGSSYREPATLAALPIRDSIEPLAGAAVADPVPFEEAAASAQALQ
jgi:hypothetical protein